MEASVDVSEVIAFAQRMNVAPEVIQRHIGDALMMGGLTIEAGAKDRAPVDTGKLKQSITARPVTPYTVEVGTTLTYAPTMEYGRAPGSAMPPEGALLDWMHRNKLGDVSEYVIRRAIAVRGIPAKRFFRDSVEANRSKIEGFFLTAAMKITGEVFRG